MTVAGTAGGDVLCVVAGKLGRITLNRPRALNALSHSMVVQLGAALESWRNDDTVATVLLDGAGDRGLCAGGDIRALYDWARNGDTAAAAQYWSDEYRLNAAIAAYPKPIVVLMDGIVMGGGVGLAGHASHRVVSADSTVAMPETTIGFSPDVGGNFLLSRCPGELGAHLALTSDRMTAGDALVCGFADVYIPLDRRAELLARLADSDVDEVLESLRQTPPPSALAEQRGWIDECYHGDSVVTIVERLSGHPNAGANAAAESIVSRSPTAVKVSLRALRLAAADTELTQTLTRDLRMAVRLLGSPDFAEGVRAQVIDKDRDPHWVPASLREVGDAAVADYFSSLGDRDLQLDLPDAAPASA